MRKLTANLSHITDTELMQLNVSEYLIHMSKLNCDYKAIKNAIASSHDDLDLEINFIAVSQSARYQLVTSSLLPFHFLIFCQVDLDHLEVIHIPVKEILLRLRQNSILFDILSIKNKRFQRANVLGE